MTHRQYGDDEAWLERPRDYASLAANFFRLHGRPMPEPLHAAIREVQRDHRPTR